MEVRRAVEEFEDEARRLAVEGLEARVAPRYEPTTVATIDGRGGARAG
jgi:hypothetical protein